MTSACHSYYLFSHILRILSHTSLYHINNYRSIQTYILFIIPSTFFHTFLLCILTTLIWIKYTSHTYTPIYSSNANVTHRPKFFIHILITFIDISKYCENVFIRFQYSIDISLLFNSNILSMNSLTSLFHISSVYIRLCNIIHTLKVIIDGLGPFIFSS